VGEGTDDSPPVLGAPTGVRIGTSGWAYKHWRSVVYPDGLPARRWFEHYATLFDTVELNTTFYRLPTAEAVDRWAEAAPAGFEYALKLGSFGSHRMKLADPARWLTNHVERTCRLGESLGVTVVQLPPRWRRSTERLDEFLACAASLAPGTAWAVELREPSWLHDDVFGVLARHGAALVVHDLLADHPIELTAPYTYLRFHGPHAPGSPYHGRYGPTVLRRWAQRIDAWASEGIAVRAYFNNDQGGDAVHDAHLLRRLL